MARLQRRWGLHDTRQVLVVLLVFACTGISVMYVKRWIYAAAGWAPEDWAWWQRLLGLFFIVLPIYQVLLWMYGTLFGQRAFFEAFLMRMFSRLIWWKKRP
jgi:hypothetical protein